VIPSQTDSAEFLCSSAVDESNSGRLMQSKFGQKVRRGGHTTTKHAHDRCTLRPAQACFEAFAAAAQSRNLVYCILL
jgi:hypothetical protein